MTMFRVGPAGIPASLKNAMNAVFNKKFGTTGQNYPPKQWPDDVNLLGPLPEKTASGAIAHITDGADTVPVKSWLVTLPASLDGYSEIGCTKSGKNLANIGAVTTCTNRPGSITNNGDGTITVTTGNQQNVKSMQTLGDICPYVKVGEEYYLSADSTGTNKYIYLHQVSTIWNYGAKKTITAEMLASDVSFYASGANGTTATISNLMLRPAIDTDATYEAYTAPTTATASLGRTIYGGTADVVNGTGTETYLKYVVDGVNNYAINVSGTNFNIMPYGLTGIDGTTANWVCDTLTANNTNFGYNSSNGFIFFRQAAWSSLSGVTDVATFNAYCQEHPITFLLPLTTATDFTFTPIPTPETPLGVSNWWADNGDSSVTYRADIDLLLSSLSGSRGLMMASRPVTQLVGEESDPDQVNELVEDDENNIREQLNEVVENDETEQEGENDAR